jgi:hypothetical protein
MNGGSTYEFKGKTRTGPTDEWGESCAVHIHQDKGRSKDYPAAAHFKEWDTRKWSVARWTIGSDDSKIFFAYY